MDRRRGNSTRPATSEELDCWSTRTADSLRTLASKYESTTTIETIGRVNKLISTWPVDDMLPADGMEGINAMHKKLVPSIQEIKRISEEELKVIDHATEQVAILLALRKAPENAEKRKRPRGPSPSAFSTGNQTGNNRGVSITLPARPSPTGPPPRDAKPRRDALTRQLPLQQGRKIAFHPAAAKLANGNGPDTDENTWILALVTKCLSVEKNRYEVQDAEPQEDGQPGSLYFATLRAIIPLPDPNAPAGNPAHVNSYQEFPAGATVMALYPDTSCFYRAEVIATPKDLAPSGRGPHSSKHMPIYKLKFEDDDNQEHSVAAQWVVDWPGNVK
ncbi:SGF29 tudor-like domain containing protein [Amanita muscaria]